MRIIDIAEHIDREQLCEEIFPYYAEAFLPETFSKIVGSFLFYAKGNEFYVKEMGEETHIFAAHGNDVSIELVFSDEGVDFLSYICPLAELEESDLEKNLEDEYINPMIFFTSYN